MRQRGIDEANKEVVHWRTGLWRSEYRDKLAPEIDTQHSNLGRGVGVENEECLWVSAAHAHTSSRSSLN